MFTSGFDTGPFHTSLNSVWNHATSARLRVELLETLGLLNIQMVQISMCIYAWFVRRFRKVIEITFVFSKKNQKLKILLENK